MNDNAKKWVAALRSGEFEQGRECLCRNDKYCCLGVACILAERSGMVFEKKKTLSDGRVDFGDYTTASLPADVTIWLGLRTNTGEYRNGERALWKDNDDGMTFPKIADIIESEPEGLFVK